VALLCHSCTCCHFALAHSTFTGTSVKLIRITETGLKEALRHILDGMSVRKAAERVGFPGASSSIHRYWKGVVGSDGLQLHKGVVEYTGFTDEETTEARRTAINQLHLHDLGSPEFKVQSFFTDGDLDVFAATVGLFGDFGFPFDYDSFKAMAQRAARKKLEEDVRRGRRESFNDTLVSDGGDIPDCGFTFFKKYVSCECIPVRS
jgi:hypothetical protein